MTTVRVVALAFWAATGLGLSAAELTSGQWQADLAFLAKELPQRHKNLFHSLQRAEFERLTAQLSADIPRLTEIEIRGRIARLVAAARDGHTYASLDSDCYFDLIVLEFPEGPFVVSAAKASDAVGARLLSIDGVPADELRSRLVGYVSAENSYGAAAYTAYLRNPAALLAAGITHSSETADFRFEKGGRVFTVSARARDQKKERTPEWTLTPASFQKRASEYYWFEFLPQTRTLYIQYNSCQEMPSLPFAKFTAQVLETARRESPAKMVIDLRNNGGGNSEVINPLLEAIAANPALKPGGGIYALVGPGTFSSGTLAALELRKRFQAMLAGEFMAQRPNSYGDIRYFLLPNSKIAVSYSTKRFAMAEGDPEALDVELPVPLTTSGYFAGRDAALDAILKLPASLPDNYRRVIATSPHCASAYLSLFQLTHDPQILRDGVASNPRAAELRMALAAYYADRKNYIEARRVLAGDSTAPGVQYELGLVYLAEGKAEQAAAAFRQSYRSEPENLRGLEGIADIYLKRLKPEEALRILDEEAAKHEDDPAVPLLAATIAARAGKSDIQIADFRTAIRRLEQRHGDTFEIHLGLSEVYRRTAKPAEAIREFLAGCDAIKSSLRLTGGSFNRMLLGPMAHHFEQALDKEPSDAVLMHNLAYMLAAAGSDKDRALSLALRAAELLPEVDEARDNVGLVRLSRQEWQPALDWFRPLASRNPGNWAFRYHLALALAGAGDSDAAASELREALRLVPPEGQEAEIRALLAKVTGATR